MPVIMVHDHARRGVPDLLLDETHALVPIQGIGDVRCPTCVVALLQDRLGVDRDKTHALK